MKKLYLVFALFLLVSSAANFALAQTKNSANLRVMTFNIRYDEPRDGADAWQFRKQKVADVIRFHKADLVGVQEALFGQLKDLETLLPGFAWLGAGRTDGKEDGEFSAVFYRKDRFKLLETKTFWLSETPATAGSKSWDAALPRIVTWAKFQDKSTKKIFFHFNTHFDHIGEQARQESAKLILSNIEKLAEKIFPYVLTGDFNVVEDSAAYKILTGRDPEKSAAALRLQDARYSSRNGHFGGNSTFNGFKELIPNRKIDYIFVKNGTKVFEHGILSDLWDGRWASDHLPVLAEIAF